MKQHRDDGVRRAVFTPVDNRARVETVVHRIGDAIELGRGGRAGAPRGGVVGGRAGARGAGDPPAG
ncbi:hypothetical protein ACFXGX_01610, partial [Streptomyces sp. NPDC059371]